MRAIEAFSDFQRSAPEPSQILFPAFAFVAIVLFAARWVQNCKYDKQC